MPPLRRKQFSNVYENYREQKGKGANMVTFPVYKSNLTRIQGGSGFLRRLFHKVKKGVQNLDNKMGSIPKDVIKEVGSAVLQDVKHNAPEVFLGTKKIKDVINPQSLLDKTFSAVHHAAAHRLTQTPQPQQQGTGDIIYSVKPQISQLSRRSSIMSNNGSEPKRKKRKMNVFGELTPK